MRVILLIGTLAMLVGNSPARATDDCAPASTATKLLSFDMNEQDTRLGFEVALQFGLDPGTFPKEQISHRSGLCPHGTFRADGAQYAVLGNGENLPPRWAESATHPETIAFLALMPKPQSALAWAKKHAEGRETEATFKPGDMMYVLAIANGTERNLYVYFDGIPDDSTMAMSMCGALTGQLPIIGTYHTESGESSFSGSPESKSLNGIKNCTVLPGH